MSKTTAFLKIGDKFEIVKLGQIIEMYDGNKFTFLGMRRTKWEGKSQKDGKNWLIRSAAKAIVGFDDSVLAQKATPTKMKMGDLFAIVGKREVYMFKSIAQTKIKAIGVSDGTNWTIDTSFELKKIDLKEIKEKVING